MKKLLLVLGVAVLFVGCGELGDPQAELPEPTPEPVVNNSNTEKVEESALEKFILDEVIELVKGDMATSDSGLKYEVLEVGTGERAQNGDTVSVHYTGWLTDGTKFDSSVDRGTPFQFILGKRQVIKGWDEGVTGCEKGSHDV